MHSLDRVLPIGANYFMQTIGHKNQNTLNNERVIFGKFVNLNIIRMLFVHNKAMSYRLIPE